MHPSRPAPSRLALSCALVSALGLPVHASGVHAQPTPAQTSADSYTRYELQAPGSAAFRILYDVTATTAGAVAYFNSIRAGAEEEVHAVTDLHSGAPLEWDVVDGGEARRTGHPRASPDGRYIRVHLARAVPERGEGRIRIDKTYVDPDSYLVEGDEVVFTRSLGIRRNAVVLPPGYELVAVNHPSQVAREDDGRIRVSFMNPGPEGVPYEVRGRRLSPDAAAALAEPSPPAPEADEPPLAPDDAAGARLGYHAPERASQTREIVYFLLQPETHSFRLYHDYTETRPDVDRYLNVVRGGSRVSDPAAVNLDTGEALEVETLRGEVVVDAGLLPADRVGSDTEVVVIQFEPPVEGGSVRLRIYETYTDPGRYTLVEDELVWDRGFGRSLNDVVLPDGWMLTESAMPAVVSTEGDGRVRLSFENPRPDDLQVFLRARRR